MQTAIRRILGPLMLAALTSMIVAGTARSDTTLRWKFKAGQKRTYTLTRKSSVKTEVMGRPTETISTHTVDFTWEVKGIDSDGNAEVAQTIHQIKVQLRGPSENLEIDSNRPRDFPLLFEPLGELFRSMTTAPFTLKISPRGEIREVAVPPQVVEAIKNAGPTGAELADDEDLLKNLTHQAIVVFPGEAIAQGKSWSAVKTVPQPGSTLVMDTAYTLDPATGPIQNIAVDARVKIEPQPGSPVQTNLSSQQVKGLFRFDNAVGFPIDSKLVRKLGLVTFFNGQKIVSEEETTITMELKADGAAK